MERVRRNVGFRCGIEVGSEGSRGGMALCWKEDCKVQLGSYSINHIDLLVEEDLDGYQWRFTWFYGFMGHRLRVVVFSL